MSFNDSFFPAAGHVILPDYHVVSGDEFRNHPSSGALPE